MSDADVAAGSGGVDLLTPERVADPYPVFAESAPAEQPVFYNEHYRAWFIHRHDDLLAALKDPRFSSDRIRPCSSTSSARISAASAPPPTRSWASGWCSGTRPTTPACASW